MVSSQSGCTIPAPWRSHLWRSSFPLDIRCTDEGGNRWSLKRRPNQCTPCGSSTAHFARYKLSSLSLIIRIMFRLTKHFALNMFLQLLGWIVAAPFILGALYVVFVPCFKFLISRFNAAPSSPKKQRAIWALRDSRGERSTKQLDEDIMLQDRWTLILLCQSGLRHFPW